MVPTVASNLVAHDYLVRGPTSSVLLATDRDTGRHVAVKEIALAQPEAAQELLVAQKLLRLGIAHPHVLTYDAVFVDGDSLFLVMEMCAQGDLHSVLERLPDQRLREHDALHVWRQVVEGVAFLHDHGLAHRDLSLENVLIDDRGHAKVCDFGLSVCVDKGAHSRVVGRVGKPYYMAPEVFASTADDTSYDALRADVWSLGALLFVLLTGAPLVEAAAPSDAAFRALGRVGVTGILRSWRMDRDVSQHTAALLERLLRPSPCARPANAREVLRMI